MGVAVEDGMTFIFGIHKATLGLMSARYLDLTDNTNIYGISEPILAEQVKKASLGLSWVGVFKRFSF